MRLRCWCREGRGEGVGEKEAGAGGWCQRLGVGAEWGMRSGFGFLGSGVTLPWTGLVREIV
jgi:hypothetical protein